MSYDYIAAGLLERLRPVMLDGANTKDPDAIINAVLLLQPGFGGVNLENISQPKCFYYVLLIRDAALSVRSFPGAAIRVMKFLHEMRPLFQFRQFAGSIN